ncbi:MAG: DUF1835 domain-containing protein [Actinomycetota bacterium]
MDLIITNGDAAGELLRRAISGAEVLPWRDVLHEGPVPQTKTLAELTAIRAIYLADRGWGERDEIAANLQARDRGLARASHFDRVVLWFEHDLYDQLQLLQILDWFSQEEPPELLLVQASEFLGRQTEDEIEALRVSEQPVTQEQLALAAEAWAAFRAPTPEPWQALLGGDLSPLPFLDAAVRRMLEELPGRDGLSRSERQILTGLASGITAPPALFVAVQRTEQAVFMGDWSFWGLLDGLALARVPLIEGLADTPFGPERASLASPYFQSRLALTAFGEAVLEGREDNAALNRIDRWWGGTHLANDALWRFDAETEWLIAPAST